ncbi:YXWGXW repeat-containing protein [Oleiharenicola lentus]|uniref:YXWGXW repeat-containing protein n=1 Tax=Oleiharenicola lentus TaxID=2508720 RepID=UPI003F6768A2
MNTPNSTLKSSRIIPLLSLASLALFATGCGSYPESNVVSAPPPQVVQPQQQQVIVTQQPVAAQVVTATPLANGQILINQAPPVQQQVIVTQPARPSSSHVWVEGYWTWRNDRYEWVAAHWEVPPFSGAKWVAPRSERISENNYRFYEGYWN